MTNVLTGGIVSVEDGTKKSEEYAPPRKVRVELHFALPEGTSDGQMFLDAVAAQADAKVRQLLMGTTAAPKPADAPRRGPGRPAADPKPEQYGKSQGIEALKTDKDKLAEAAGVGAPVTGKEAPKPEMKPDPAAIMDDETAAVVEEEDSFSVPAVEEVKPISDEELNSSVGKKNATLNKPPMIRDLVATFKPEGWTKQFTMRDIPQAQRPDFLKKLSELK